MLVMILVLHVLMMLTAKLVLQLLTAINVSVTMDGVLMIMHAYVLFLIVKHVPVLPAKYATMAIF